MTYALELFTIVYHQNPKHYRGTLIENLTPAILSSQEIQFEILKDLTLP